MPMLDLGDAIRNEEVFDPTEYFSQAFPLRNGCVSEQLRAFRKVTCACVHVR